MAALSMKDGAAAVARLSPRQREVLRLLIEGQARKEIAQELGISLATVGFHCEAIYARLGVSSVAQAVVVALRSGAEIQPKSF